MTGQTGPSEGFDDEATAAQIAAEFDLNALDPKFLENPYPTYHALRRYDPVHCNPDGTYVLTRYRDLMAVYRDRRYSSDKTREFKPKYGDGPLYLHHTTSLVFNDPPLHTRVRQLLAPAFTPRALKSLEPTFVALVDRLLDEAAEGGRIDLIGDFASRLPIQIIGDMLGVPEEERAPLRGWSLLILGALEPVLTPAQLTAGNNAVAEFSAYLDDLIGERRRHLGDPDNDVLTALIVGSPDGEKLSHVELVQNCIFLLNAGHETTTNLIGNAVDALFRFPDQLDRLRAEPGLIVPAVEEFLRFESSNQFGNRRVAEDLEIDGNAMPAGTYIHLCIGAGNRDPDVFAEPDRLDIERTPNKHLAFAAGIHACAGMTLARMEGRIAIGRLIERLPRLRPTGRCERGGRARFRGFKSYEVEF